MQKQVEVKNISYFKNILYSVQKQGDFKIVFVIESFDTFLCREAGWGQKFCWGLQTSTSLNAAADSETC